MRVGARFGETAEVGIQVRRARDPVLDAEWVAALVDGGFGPSVEGDIVHLTGVGVAHGDRSVDVVIQALDLDEHRVLEIRAPIRSQAATFEVAALAAVRGSGACHLAKFDVEERPGDQGMPTLFGLVARFHLFADHLSADELRVMLALFLKEVDEIDNELARIMAGG